MEDIGSKEDIESMEKITWRVEHLDMDEDIYCDNLIPNCGTPCMLSTVLLLKSFVFKNDFKRGTVLQPLPCIKSQLIGLKGLAYWQEAFVIFVFTVLSLTV